jgi:predicted DNA-binding ribbon-helix-helix protein
MAKKKKPDVAQTTLRLPRQLMIDLKVIAARERTTIKNLLQEAARWIVGGRK